MRGKGRRPPRGEKSKRSSLTDVPRGQSLCPGYPECEKVFNNANKPETCDNCGSFVGGQKIMKTAECKAWKLDGDIFSVRENVKGVETRIFVDLSNKSCQSKKCSVSRTSYIQGGNDINQFSCPHIELCKSAKIAECTWVKIDEELKKLLPKKALDSLISLSEDEKIGIYILPNNFVVVPSFSEKTRELPTKFCHVRNDKCNLQHCKDKKRQHTLGQYFSGPICLHQMAAWISGRNVKKPDKPPTKEHNLKVDISWSVTNVLDAVLKEFPQLHEEEKIKQFLTLESKTVESLKTEDSLDKFVNKRCEGCNRICERWRPNKPQKGDGLLITLGGMRTIDIPAYHCPRCKVLAYPNMAELGFIVIHTKLCISFNMLIDIGNQLEIGVPLIESIKMKLHLLAQAAEIDIESELVDLAVKIEKASITILSSLITGESLNEVICYICGAYPKIVFTDGNSNDSSPIDTKSMVFVETDDPVEDLQTFLRKLQVHILSTVFYQNVPNLQINLLKLPPIIAPKLLGEAVNREGMKKSQFDKSKGTPANVDVHNLSQLITSGELNISNLELHSTAELKKLCKKCNIPTGQSNSFMISSIITVYKNLLSGQGNCHKYVHVQRRTGGVQDCWCEHYLKVGAKFQCRQESVVDPVDLIHSLKCVPVLHVCDDACTVISHSFLAFEEKSKIMFGEKRGCFQVPNKDIKASKETTPDNSDILPLKYTETKPDITAATDGGMRHPDTGHCQRYVMGHRLQYKSHKKNLCSYQQLDLTKSGLLVDSLGQEGLQVKRKYGRVQQDRNRNFFVTFMANYVLDFMHNRKKAKEQMKMLKSDQFQGSYMGRDDVLWRAIIRN